jgi:hypothetical protein
METSVHLYFDNVLRSLLLPNELQHVLLLCVVFIPSLACPLPHILCFHYQQEAPGRTLRSLSPQKPALQTEDCVRDLWTS